MLATLSLPANKELREQCVRKTYTHGALVLCADAANRQDIERFIEDGAFLRIDEASKVPTSNRRYRVYMFELPSVGIDAVMKVSWDNPAYPRWRRQVIRITEIFRDRSEAAFLGALTLLRAGVPTLKPLACWTYQPKTGSRESYFLYEKIDAACSVRDLRLGGSADDQVTSSLERIARLLSRFHKMSLWHQDLSLSNFLISSTAGRGEDPSQENGAPVYLIDTDSVKKRRFRLPFFARIREINALRRMNLTPAEIERFLRHYLGTSYRPGWLLVYHFCASHACRPWRPLIRSLKRAGCW